MSDSVKKIFMVLIVAVACVMIGAFVLNVLMPNLIKTGTNAVEGQLYNATGIRVDMNGDGFDQNTNQTYTGGVQAGTGNGTGDTSGKNVGGFKKAN